ncbi:MAG TPA: DinB family protein [Chitinophagaceae bacterium]|jgi:hypothetical protein|nr:DinB family protein [Chitinophagaceae bacterium]
MKSIVWIGLLLFAALTGAAQQQKHWTEADRNYLLEHLTRSRDEVLRETGSLTEAQWNFKESDGRWSIREVVEHIALWELLFQREISQAYKSGPQPELLAGARPDSAVLGFLQEEKPHVSVEYTKPFTFSLPMGLNPGASYIAWFTKMRNESLQYVGTATEDLRVYFLKPGRGSIHQLFLSTFGHTDRHLRQIRKIKQHPKYPR